jgi:HEPN domain-containing protein
VEELVENHGAYLDLATFEAQNSKLTALCVASVRGMPKVVKYLLEKGASRYIKCSGRFRLYTNARKSVRCNDSTALEFAQEMKKAELDEGSSEQNVGNLKKCIKLLQKDE